MKSVHFGGRITSRYLAVQATADNATRFPTNSSFPLTHTVGHLPETGSIAGLAGRVKTVRKVSKRIQFVDLWDTSGASYPGQRSTVPLVQVKMKDVVATTPTIAPTSTSLSSSSAAVSSSPAPASVVIEDKVGLRRGDVVAVRGTVSTDRRNGNPLILADSVELLTPCTTRAVPPTELTDPEIRFRHRHLDLFTDQAQGRDAALALHVRSRLVAKLRWFLAERLGFTEVETPILGRLAGGATAQPFRTVASRSGGAYSGHGSLVLRISPELYLKRAVCAGFGRVFEIGKCFRDEGIDATHSPEYTMCELYQAHADCDQLIGLTEQLFAFLCEQMNNDLAASADPDLDPDARGPATVFQGLDGVAVDFTPPFRRVDFVDELEARGNAGRDQFVPLPGDLSDSRALAEWASAVSVPAPVSSSDVGGTDDAGRWLDHLFSHVVEPHLGPQPTFVCDHPAALCPLAKGHRDPAKRARGLTERFELFVGGVEWCNAYTELNDPAEQRARFLTQANGDESKLDEQFLAALEFGLPPTAGWGFGVDRAVMLFSKSRTLRETLLFPLLKQKGR